MLKNNKTIGSIFIVAGTTIGGGMVAMPIALSGVGFGVSILILLVMWMVMIYCAFLMVELYQYHSPYTTPTQMAEYYLGKAGRIVLNLSMLILMIALIAAYIAGGGELFHVIGKDYFGQDYPNYFYSTLMAVIFAIALVLGTDTVDLLNKFLFILKVIVLFVILASMFYLVQIKNLTTIPQNNFVIWAALPLVCTAFGFHTCIQSLEIYLEGNKSLLKKVLFWGSLIPLILYILWELVIFGGLNHDTLNEVIQQGAGVDSISLTIRQLLGSSYIEFGVKLFVLLAILTSFLGVSLGLFDFISTGMWLDKNILGRVVSVSITFLLPILFVVFYPKGFIMALGGAAIAFSLMALIIPSMMVWKERAETTEEMTSYKVKGGQWALLLVFIFGWLIIFTQIFILLGWLPPIG